MFGDHESVLTDHAVFADHRGRNAWTELMFGSLRALVTLGVISAPLPGFLSAQATEAAQTITARDIAHHVAILADDSMLGRDTPSRGLELTARYIADQFARLGLTPASAIRPQVGPFGVGLNNANRVATWFQRYPVPLQLDFARSQVLFTADSQQAAAEFPTAVRLASSFLPSQPAKEKTFLVAGNHTAESLRRVDTHDRVVLYVPPRTMDPDSQRTVIERLAGTSQGLVVLSEEDSATFSRRSRADFHRVIRRAKAPRWAVHVRPAAVAGLRDVFAAAGLDLPRVRADTTPLARDLPSLQMAFAARFRGISDDTATAPNVVGMLEGRDAELKGEYVVITAHMDYVGVSVGGADSIHNGASDNASGTAGLLALAKALSQPGARPRRSIIFVGTSGGAKPGFWGSTAFVDGLFWADPAGFVSDGKKPQLQVVAHINLDMIGGTARDSVTIDGLRTIDLKTPPTWVAALHAELRLTVVDGGTVVSPRSDQFAFTSGPATVPSLNFRNGSHGDGRAGPDSGATVNAEQAERIVRLVFYVSQEIANADWPPRWNAEGRRQLGSGGTP